MANDENNANKFQNKTPERDNDYGAMGNASYNINKQVMVATALLGEGALQTMINATTAVIDAIAPNKNDMNLYQKLLVTNNTAALEAAADICAEKGFKCSNLPAHLQLNKGANER
jgi:hypothetical protein